MSSSRPVTLKVLFFGATADAVGVRRIDLQVPAGSTSGAAFADVIERYPRLAGHKLLYSVNQEYAGGREILNDGDELALFTAVSGG